IYLSSSIIIFCNRPRLVISWRRDSFSRRSAKMLPVNRLRLGTPAFSKNLPCCAAPSRCPLLQHSGRRSAATAVTAAAGGAGFTDGMTPMSGAAPATNSHPNSTSVDGTKQHDSEVQISAPAAPPVENEAKTLLGRLKRFFAGSKLDKARLAALGFGAFSAYGVISNINAAILITIAWLTVVRTTGLTPLDGGNWPCFLGIYAGLWIGSNFLRPLRLTLALAAAPFFDAAIGAVSRRTGLPKVPAFVVMLLMIAVGTTSTLLAVIAMFGGFPAGCRMPWQPAVA
ncbi:hypothetical protein Vretimale_16006, partial [Volvox reticuliferus]